MEPDQRDVALRADRAARGEGLGDVDDLGALDIGARPRGRRIGGGQRPPGRLDRDRPDRKARRMARVGQVQPAAPAVRGERRELGLVEMDLVARIGAVLRDERIGGRADGEARLVEVGERLERSDRLLPIVDAGPARVAPGVARPGRGRDAAAVVVDLEQLVVGLERLPHALARIAERPFAIGIAAAGRLVDSEGQLSAMKARQAKLATTSARVGRRVVEPVRRDRSARGPSRSAPARRDSGRGEERGDGAGAPRQVFVRGPGIATAALIRRVRAARRSTRRRGRMSARTRNPPAMATFFWNSIVWSAARWKKSAVSRQKPASAIAAQRVFRPKRTRRPPPSSVRITSGSSAEATPWSRM